MFRTPELFRAPRLFVYLLVSLAMSGYDAVATMNLITRGVATEGNPLMASLIQKHALIFFMVKMALTAVCLIFCYAYSHLRVGRLGLKFTVAVYSLLSIY